MPPDSGNFSRFVTEAREHLAVIGEALITLERSPEQRQACVERLLRSTHSLKGGAGFVGRRQIELLAHAMETAAENIRDGRVPASPDAVDALLFALDRITALLDDVEHSEDADIREPLSRLAPLLETGPATVSINRMAAPSAPSAPVAGPGDFSISPRLHEVSLDPGASLYGVKFDWHACEIQLGLSPTDVAQRLEGVGTVLDSQLEFSGPPLADALPAPPFWYRAILSSVLTPEEFSRRLAIPIAGIARLERIPSRPAAPGSAAVAAAPPAAHAAPSSLRVSVSLIDRMMELAGELALVRNQALRTASVNDAPMRRLMRRLDSVTSDLHDAALRMRMQPVATLFDRFPRLVRDLARQLGKTIEITIVGSEVELDKTVLEILADPLTHLVRNCCDHGIELPAQRIASGKAALGVLRLSARQDRGQIVVEVRDDGRGIDATVVRRKALEQGLKTREELDRLNSRQVCELIMISGFSTAAAVTDVSGRGVGMDVVKTNLERIGGVVEIESTPGQGTVFSLRLPLTLAIMPCLLLRSGPDCYALPQRDVEEILLLEPANSRARLECSHDEEVLRLRNVLLPAVRLAEVFTRNEPFDAHTWSGIIARYHGPQALPTRGYAAVVRAGTRRFVMTFDEVLESEDIVVKPLNPLLRPLSIYSGSTILGDGGVALILSVEGVARHCGLHQRPLAQAVAELPASSEPAEQLGVLLTRYGSDQLLAVPLADIRRVLMVSGDKLERVGDRELVHVDSVTFNVLRLEIFLNLAPSPAPWYFLIVPRRTGTPLAIPVTEIVDSHVIEGPLNREAFMVAGVLGTAMIRGHIALILSMEQLAAMWEQGNGSAAKALPAPADDSGARRHVLLVEDTQFFRALVGNCLRQENIDVSFAVNGQEALETLRRDHFDLVVCDIEMPVMDGLSFAQQVRADPDLRHTPLLALTTLNSPEHRQRALDCGFDAYETKFDRARFLAAVASLLTHAILSSPNRGSTSHD